VVIVNIIWTTWRSCLCFIVNIMLSGVCLLSHLTTTYFSTTVVVVLVLYMYPVTVLAVSTRQRALEIKLSFTKTFLIPNSVPCNTVMRNWLKIASDYHYNVVVSMQYFLQDAWQPSLSCCLRSSVEQPSTAGDVITVADNHSATFEDWTVYYMNLQLATTLLVFFCISCFIVTVYVYVYYVSDLEVFS